MKFRKALRSGNYLKRERSEVRAAVDGNLRVSFWLSVGGLLREFHPSVIDLLADDWEVVYEPNGARNGHALAMSDSDTTITGSVQ